MRRLVDDVEGREEGEQREQREEHGCEAFAAGAGGGEAEEAEGGTGHGVWWCGFMGGFCGGGEEVIVPLCLGGFALSACS